jgi:hypothetical protein
MKLSAEVFAHITGSLRSDELALVTGEKRKSPRVGFRGQLIIRVISAAGPGAPVRVRLRDLSRTSIGFLHRQNLPVGRKFVICLSNDSTEPGGVTQLLYQVVRCDALDDGLFAIGATFVQTSPAKPVKPAK